MTKCGTIIIPGHVCPSCGCEMVYIEDVDSWYCSNCETWIVDKKEESDNEPST